jgi:hypothetical protein
MTDADALAIEFEREMYRGVRSLAALGYHATRFERMLHDHGGVEAARRLVNGTISEGLRTLQRMDRLDMSVELWALFDRYQTLFDVATRDKARRKLRQLGVNVEQALQQHPQNHAE